MPTFNSPVTLQLVFDAQLQLRPWLGLKGGNGCRRGVQLIEIQSFCSSFMSLAFLFLLSVFFLLCPLFCLISLSTTTTSSAPSPRPHHRHLRFQWIIKQKSEVQRRARSLRYKSIPEKRQNLHSPLGRWELEMELQTGNGSLAAKHPSNHAEAVGNFQVGGIVASWGSRPFGLLRFHRKFCVRALCRKAAHAYLEFMATVKSNGIE